MCRTDLQAEKPDMQEISDAEAEKILAANKKKVADKKIKPVVKDTGTPTELGELNEFESIKEQVDAIRTKSAMATFAKTHGDIEFDGTPTLGEMKELYIEAIAAELGVELKSDDEAESEDGKAAEGDGE